MYIKVCGMRDARNIRDVEALGVDILGFIFWPGSKRYVAEKPGYLPEKAQRAGVFVNATHEEMIQKAKDYRLDYIQLHGDEDLDYATRLRTLLAASLDKVPRIVRAIHVASHSKVLEATKWDGYVDAILFETPTSGYGGSGETFDWSLLSAYQGQTPFFLTGGIGPQSIDAILTFKHPKWIGVDLNSRFELAPAMKDVALLKPFVEALREGKNG